MTLLLTSCSSGDSNMVRDLFKKNERETANERFEALIGAIQNQDRVALKAFFSEKSLKESQNIEETITALFDYFRGDMLSYNDWGSLGSIGGMNEDGTGRYWKCLYGLFCSGALIFLAIGFFSGLGGFRQYFSSLAARRWREKRKRARQARFAKEGK